MDIEFEDRKVVKLSGNDTRTVLHSDVFVRWSGDERTYLGTLSHPGSSTSKYAFNASSAGDAYLDAIQTMIDQSSDLIFVDVKTELSRTLIESPLMTPALLDRSARRAHIVLKLRGASDDAVCYLNWLPEYAEAQYRVPGHWDTSRKFRLAITAPHLLDLRLLHSEIQQAITWENIDSLELRCDNTDTLLRTWPPRPHI